MLGRDTHASLVPHGPHGGPMGPRFFRASPARPPELAPKNPWSHGRKKFRGPGGGGLAAVANGGGQAARMPEALGPQGWENIGIWYEPAVSGSFRNIFWAAIA